MQGRIILLLVAFLYGTLNVTLRAVYATEGPPAASVLSLVRQLLSVGTFVPIFIAAGDGDDNKGGGSTGIDDESSGGGDDDGMIIMAEDVEKQSSLMAVGKNGDVTGGEVVKEKEVGVLRPMWMSALELAFWNFGAQGFINAGLLFSPAARASFLTQTSVVMTPLISAMAGESVKSSVWGGCGLALVGLYIISTSASPSGGNVEDAAAMMDSAVVSSAAITGFNQGDAMILLGALSWSMYIFRTSKLANSYSELNLQFTKTALLAVMYLGWFLTTAISTLSEAGDGTSLGLTTQALLPLWSGWNSPLVWLLLAYSAVGPGAVADLLQQRGQRETSASESNIILCLESVFAAICAYVLLGEVSSMGEVAGGSLIVAAAILASK